MKANLVCCGAVVEDGPGFSLLRRNRITERLFLVAVFIALYKVVGPVVEILNATTEMKATWECFSVMVLTSILLDAGGSIH